MKRNNIQSQRAWFDVVLLALSVCIAVFLGYSHAFEYLFSFMNGFGFLGIFVVGFFFTSVFTVAPAIVALGEVSLLYPWYQVIFFGALGATLVDYILFHFVKDRIISDAGYFLQNSTRYQKIMHLAGKRKFRYLSLLCALFLIASPLPDETALTILGASKSKTKDVLFVMFLANVLGVAAIVFATQAFLV